MAALSPIEVLDCKTWHFGTNSALSEVVVHGLITTRHLVSHGPLIVRLFGMRTYLRCWRRALLERGTCTFLQEIR